MNLTTTILYTILALISHLVFKVARNRWRIRKLPTAGPYHPLFGSIPVITEMKKNVPDDLHLHCWGLYLKEKYPLDKLVYLDLSPLMNPEIFIIDPDLANQVTVVHSLPKSRGLKTYILPVAGPHNMLTLEGPTWKRLRTMFNPGFSASHLATLVPVIIEETCVFADVLREYAQKNTLFPMLDAAANLTVDVIARVALPTKFNSQITENEFISAFRDQTNDLEAVGSLNPFANLSPFWKWRVAQRTKKMNKYIGEILDDHYRLRKEQGLEKTKSKKIIDLALDLHEKDGLKHPSDPMKMNPEFREFAIDQIKTFIIAGHDTASSAICYIFYLLHSHPEAYAKLAEELDTILDPTTSGSIDKILSDPRILNSLHYTNGVIKEALRLYPPTTSRRRKVDFSIVDPKTKIEYPTYGWTVWANPNAMQRSAEYFPEPNSFIPERWLPDSTTSPPINKDAWQPFSKGPRNCIGQELSMVELRIVVALTVRDFDFVAEYPELPKGADRKKYEFFGDRAYPIVALTAKPKDGLPGRIRLRNPDQKK